MIAPHTAGTADSTTGFDTDPATAGISGIADAAYCGSGVEGDVVDPAVASALREACRPIPEFLEHRRLQEDTGPRPAPILGSREKAETEPEPADANTDPKAHPATDANSGASAGSSLADPCTTATDGPFSGLGEADLISLLLRLYLITRSRTGDDLPTSSGCGGNGSDDLPVPPGGESDEDPPPF